MTTIIYNPISKSTKKYVHILFKMHRGRQSIVKTVLKLLISQQAQNIYITFVQRRPNVFDVGPALYKCYTNVLFTALPHTDQRGHNRGD